MDLTKEQLPLLVKAFYSKVWQDELIGPKFSHVNFELHLPKMVNFWSTVIFSEGTYAGSPFDKHIPLSLEKKHFDRWLELFNTTVDEHFGGETATLVKTRANIIGLTFQHKLQSLANT